MLIAAALVAAVCMLPIHGLAQSSSSVQSSSKTLTITIKGTLGPVLSGGDPLGADGKNGKLTIQASESLSPKKHTTNSATYILPAGAMTITVGSQKFQTNSKSTMIVQLTSTADILTLKASGPDGLQVTGVAYLQSGSWTNAVLKHPTTFKPSPQKLTAAKTANGPGSKVSYTIFGSMTVLGLNGTASSKDAVAGMHIFRTEF
jgi:hypothetical protein